MTEVIMMGKARSRKIRKYVLERNATKRAAVLQGMYPDSFFYVTAHPEDYFKWSVAMKVPGSDRPAYCA